MSSPKVALITAASTGLGAAIARTLVIELGMSVVINYHRNTDRAAKLVQELQDDCGVRYAKSGAPVPVVKMIQADVGEKSDVYRLVEKAAEEFDGRLDVVISNVGWTRMRNFSDLEDGLDEEDWDRCFAANVKSHLWLFHAAKKYLEESNQRERGAAVFVSTASVAGVKPSGSSLSYAVTKAALIHLVKSLATISAPSIRVNCVSPGILLTEWGLSFPEERLNAAIKANKLERFATVEDVAEQVKTFVVSKSATGQNAIIDSGFSL
ncbi:putative short chain protein [Scedosporium apiospermum]|uniref:Putative short chain protein n=1 Tax=Pseudallescheria apiosperma TaxID=563466 RepID=A0A084G9E6_PSEDA|nr:putative short chain protein [Scedosporium apiospermum]KEZ43958.1 putative short chain protein [Scedosporium apiospermum]